MCNGVVVSLIKFDVGGKTKRIVLSGIGSHSKLISNNQKKLEKAGWNVNAPNQRVFSIESDFSGWNKFTIESGDPDKTELRLLRNEYKKCAGNARALIRHVQKHGFDDALIEVLNTDAKNDYEAKRNPLYDDYEMRCKLFWIKLFRLKKNRIKELR